MASGIYNRAKANWFNKEVDMEADTIKVALLNNSHTFNADNNVYSDISTNELAATGGYTTGGATLGSKTVTQDDTNDRAVFDAADTAWTTATFTAYHAVIWDDTVSGDPLICSIDFGGAKSVTSGTFTIQWSANGIIRLT